MFLEVVGWDQPFTVQRVDGEVEDRPYPSRYPLASFRENLVRVLGRGCNGSGRSGGKLMVDGTGPSFGLLKALGMEESNEVVNVA